MMRPRTEVRTTFPRSVVASVIAGTMTALLVWMFSAAPAFAVVVG